MRADASNEELVVQIALGVLAGKGYVDDVDEEREATLRRLYRENPICQVAVRFTGEPLHDMVAGRPGEYLAACFEAECRERFEREQAERFACPCGATFGLYPFAGRKVSFLHARRRRPLRRAG